MKTFQEVCDDNFEVTPEKVQEITKLVSKEIEEYILEKGDPEGFAKSGEFIDQGFELWLRSKEAFFSVGDWCGIPDEIEKMLRKHLPKGWKVEYDAETHPKEEGWVSSKGRLRLVAEASQEIWIPLEDIYTSEIDEKLLLEDGPLVFDEMSFPRSAYWSVDEPTEEAHREEDEYMVELMEKLIEQGKLDPVVVTPVTEELARHYHKGIQGYDWLLLDGNHRYLAYLYTERPEINAVVWDWNPEAQEYQSVADHALPNLIDLEDDE